ncbi:hypothetical protein EON65_11260, partial [archaeon]
MSDGYIEVRPTNASKGTFVEHAMHLMRSGGGDPDFILCVGDDSSDEPMFEYVQNYIQNLQTNSGNQKHTHTQGHAHTHTFSQASPYTSSHSHPVSAFTVTVGKKPTLARAYVDDPAAAVELLSVLSKTVLRDPRYFSAVDLPSQGLGVG